MRRIKSQIPITYLILPLIFLIFFAVATRAAESQLFDPTLSQDGQRVIVAGEVAAYRFRMGRRDSHYTEIFISTEEGLIKVFFPDKPLPCKNVLVEGFYHEEGWFGGFPEEKFINAQAITCWKP